MFITDEGKLKLKSRLDDLAGFVTDGPLELLQIVNQMRASSIV